MGKLTIQEISKILVEKCGLKQREANSFASEMFAIINSYLQEGEQVKVKGLGTFKTTTVEARESVNVRTGERFVIESHSKISFTPDSLMKELVNKPFSQFETVVLNEGVDFGDDADTEEEDEQPEEEELPPLEQMPLMDVVDSNTPVKDEEKTIEEPAEPVVEEEPVKPVVEEPSEPVAEEEPVKPVVEEKPSESVVEDDSADPDEEEPIDLVVEFPPAEEEEEQTDVEDDDEGKPWGKWLLSGLGVLLLMAASAYGGYRYGLTEAEQVQAPVAQVVKPVKKKVQPVTPKKQDTTLVEKDSVHTEMGVSRPEVIEEVAEKPAAVKVTPEEKPIAVKEMPEEEVDKYAQMDERVRLGAYRIIGTERVVTVQPGQTFYSICKGNLGPDMQCYVEVYNGLPKNPQVKVGQQLKIPKLQWKKKRKR